MKLLALLIKFKLLKLKELNLAKLCPVDKRAKQKGCERQSN